MNLTHYNLRPTEAEDLQLSGDGDPLAGFSGAGSGDAHDPDFVRMQEIIDLMNTLFEGDGLTDNDLIGITGSSAANSTRTTPSASRRTPTHWSSSLPAPTSVPHSKVS